MTLYDVVNKIVDDAADPVPDAEIFRTIFLLVSYIDSPEVIIEAARKLDGLAAYEEAQP